MKVWPFLKTKSAFNSPSSTYHLLKSVFWELCDGETWSHSPLSLHDSSFLYFFWVSTAMLCCFREQKLYQVEELFYRIPAPSMEYRDSSSEYRIPGSQLPSTEYQDSSSEYRVAGFQLRVPSTKIQLQNTRFKHQEKENFYKGQEEPNFLQLRSLPIFTLKIVGCS